MTLDLGHSSQNFRQNQQGSVDWVQLGTSTISASVSVFHRIAAADVHVGTLTTAHAVAGTFWLSRKGEGRVGVALSRLQSFSALGNALHFGFAIDHPVRHLARTQHGYTCLALLGSLAELSTNAEAAPMILSELTDILGAPRNSRPSLRQWRSIVRCCSGILAATTFPCVTEHFLRLAGADNTWASVGEPRDVAIVLDAISKLSRQELVSIHLSGSATCAWLAAFGNYFFGLGVEIRNLNGELLHQAVSEHGHVHLYVIFGPCQEAGILVGAKSYIVRDTSDLVSTHYPLFTGRVEWNILLSTSFVGAGSELLRLGSLLEQILRSAARLFEAVATADSAIDIETLQGESDFGSLCRDWIGYHDDSRGLGYLKHARDVLPELAAIYQEPRQAADIDVHRSVLDYEEAIHRIERVCECAACNAKSASSITDRLCLSLVAESVIILLWALSLVKFDRHLRLSASGVLHVYQEWEHELGADRHHSRRRIGRLLKYLTLAKLSNIVEAVFAGSLSIHVGRTIPPDSAFTYCSYGVCVFLKMIMQLSFQPEQEKWLQVLPGTIESESGVQYQRVADAQDPMANYPRGKFRSLETLPLSLNATTNEIKAELIAKETLSELLIAFRFTSRQGSIWGIGPGSLALSIVESLGRVSCRQTNCCREIPHLEFVGILEGVGYPEPEVIASHHKSVVVRQITTGTLARVAALWTSHYHDSDSRKNVILRTGECLPCCIRQGLRHPEGVTYIIT